MTDHRSSEAQEWRRLYKTGRWQRVRLAQLRREPLCSMCLERGIITEATVCDHRTPHKGSLDLFWSAENHQSLCHSHHVGDKQRIEHRGYSSAVDDDGMPLDPRHPWNRT